MACATCAAGTYPERVELEFDGVVIEWRGPAPFLFVRLPDAEADTLADVANALTYGWGCIPCRGRIGATDFTTSLFPKDGGYLVPVKKVVQRAEGVGLGDAVSVRLSFEL